MLTTAARNKNDLLGTPCKRCKEGTSVVISRKDNFCKDCFIRFIRGKQRKQMLDDRFKVKYGNDVEKIRAMTPTVLLPLSLGKSSLVLLDIIVSQMEEQSQITRAQMGFKLKVLVMDEEGLVENIKDTKHKIQTLKEFYGLKLLSKLNITFKLLDPNSFINDNSLNQIHLGKEFEAHLIGLPENSNLKLSEILSQCPNKSTREDFLTIITSELIFRTAIEQDCSVIIFGHSMTKLADDILALTVRGRGSEISKKLSDGEVTFMDKTLHLIHPLRDVLQTEVNAYSSLSELDQFEIFNSKEEIMKKSAKNKTINELIREYFETVEIEYPEVVSTVVKIGSKLTHPDTSEDFQVRNCVLCQEPLYNDPKRWLEQITVHGGAPVLEEEERVNFQKYLDSLPEEDQQRVTTGATGVELGESNPTVPLCYGCIVSLGGSGEKKPFAWPVRRPTKAEILNEYILTDDENDEQEEDK